jgi:PPP family 3-phenylpropionic acid transporter
MRTTPLVLEVSAAGCVAAALVGALWLPRTRRAGVALSGAVPAARGAALPRPADIAALLAGRELRAFIVCSFFHWLAQAPYHGYMALAFRERGLDEGATGLAFAVAVAAEVTVMASFAWLHRLAGLQLLLVACFGASAVRWWIVAHAHSPAVLIGVQLVHGLTFGAYYVAAVHRVRELTPPHLAATGQAVFAAIVFGLGGVLGYLLAGRAFAAGGGRWAFGAAAAMEVMALVAVLTYGRMRRASR